MAEEDSEETSHAGHFKTELGIETFEDFQEAVTSIFEDASFVEQRAVLIQPMIYSVMSGVMFTTAPFHAEKMLIESTYGLGELVVSGKITPDQFEINKQTGEVSATIYPFKQYGLFVPKASMKVGDEIQVGTHKVRCVSHVNDLILASIPYKMRVQPSLADEQVEQLIKVGKRLEKAFGKPMDVEWAFDNHTLHLLQVRPITTTIQTVINEGENNSAESMKGRMVSPGKTEGYVWKQPSNEHDVAQEDFVLVAYETNPSMIYEMSKAKAIVTEIGGMLCHAAIVARELKIPCLVGVSNVMERVKNGDKIQVDAERGELTICTH